MGINLDSKSYPTYPSQRCHGFGLRLPILRFSLGSGQQRQRVGSANPMWVMYTLSFY